MAVIREKGLWELGWSFSSRLLLGSTLVGVVASVGLGLAYWHWLERRAGTPINPG
jgi:hypothetical protein